MTDGKTLYHLPCRAPCEFVGDPDHPPDPDRHGNRRFPHRCRGCGVKTTVTVSSKPRHSELLEVGFSRGEDIEWLIPLEG